MICRLTIVPSIVCSFFLFFLALALCSVLLPEHLPVFSSNRHVLNEQIKLGDKASGDLTLLLIAIQLTSKFISTNVRKASLINLSVLPYKFWSSTKDRLSLAIAS